MDAPVRRWSVNVGAVVWGLVLVVVGGGTWAREVFGLSWDWRWSVAGVLVVAGAAVVLTTVVSAVRAAAGPGAFRDGGAGDRGAEDRGAGDRGGCGPR